MSTSSPPSSFAASDQHHASSSPSRHDSSILSQDLPPMADDTVDSISSTEKHPKGKRKRTAAKDKIILEDAYKNNPKPDKQARLDIVNRVSLNEKEVQIWFQNRRQNDRRKARPLSQQELAALRFNGLHNTSSDPLSSSPAVSSVSRPVDISTSHMPNYTQAVSPSHRGVELPQPPPSAMATPCHAPISSSQPPESTPQNREMPSSQGSENGSQAMSHSFSSSVGYLANRWNLGSSYSTPSGPVPDNNGPPRSGSVPPSATSDTTHNVAQRQSQSQSQSQMRLSLSLEGKAEVVRNASSPSPQKILPELPRQRGLKRSHSAMPAVTLPPISTLTNLLPPRLSRGRSRDVQAWESCADSETRDELTTHAENESNGSAIAAISLLRSTSGVLQNSASKRNAQPQKPARYAKKAKLNRAMSSIGRLEHSGKENEGAEKPHSGKVKVSMLVSPTDSDKENWSPDEDGNPNADGARRPLPSGPKSQNCRRPGRVLQDQKGPAMLGNSRANTAPSRPRGIKEGVDIFEDAETRATRDAEVEKFMRGEVSPSKKGDMDCVAGLLSLSQGAWR